MALMLRHHIGSGRRQPIDFEWAEAYRPVANGTHSATVALRRPGGTRGPFNEATGKYDTVPATPYYTGLARVQMISDSDLKRITADQQVSALFYRVSLENTVTGVKLGDRVQVLAVNKNGDAAMVGRTFNVDTIVYSSLHWERQLVCVDILEEVT